MLIDKILGLCIAAKVFRHDCMFSYSAHVNKIEVRVYEFGWKSGADPTWVMYVGINDDERLNELISRLDKLVQGGVRMSKVTECAECGTEIYYGDATHDQDDAYEIDGVLVCGDCVGDYTKSMFFKKLEEEE